VRNGLAARPSHGNGHGNGNGLIQARPARL